MEIQRSSETPNRMTPLRIWLLAGVTAIALTAVAVNVWLIPVHAKTVQLTPAVAPASAGYASQQAVVAKPKPTLAEQRKALLRGIASWYGGDFNGQTMANGETFDENKMTACHPTLPFGSVVKVKNLRNGRSVIVRITDRGALAAGRILDLSHAAAEKLAMSNAGLAPVVLEVLSRGDGARQASSNN